MQAPDLDAKGQKDEAFSPEWTQCSHSAFWTGSSPFFQAGVEVPFGTFYQWQDSGENTAADDSVQG